MQRSEGTPPTSCIYIPIAGSCYDSVRRHKRVRQTHRASQGGDRYIIIVVGLDLIGASRREFDLYLEHVELGTRPGAVTSVGQADRFLGLRYHFLRCIGEFGGLLP